MQGIKRPVQLRPITASQLAKCIKKRCQIYVIQVGYANSKDKAATLENILVIQEFAYVFPEEIPRLPPKRDIDFTIELTPSVVHYPLVIMPSHSSVPELSLVLQGLCYVSPRQAVPTALGCPEDLL